jgi:ABC-type transport system involved in Fe-S cluster assembly fused permease/ATPase subunit
MGVVIIDVDAIPVPPPIAAAVPVVGCHDPRGMIFENESTRSKIERAQHNGTPDMRISAVRIVPIQIGAGVMFSCVMVIIAITFMMFVPAFVTSTVVVLFTIVTIIPTVTRNRQSQCRRQSESHGAYG